jgi:hypothetical protein
MEEKPLQSNKNVVYTVKAASCSDHLLSVIRVSTMFWPRRRAKQVLSNRIIGNTSREQTSFTFPLSLKGAESRHVLLITFLSSNCLLLAPGSQRKNVTEFG